MISEQVKVWAAGIMDGEGDIEIKTSGKDRRGSANMGMYD